MTPELRQELVMWNLLRHLEIPAFANLDTWTHHAAFRKDYLLVSA